MTRHLFLLQTSLFLSVVLAPTASLSAEVDSNVVQVNLAFPKANATYQPVYPFPLVFAIQNIPLLWQSTIWMSWTLYDVDSHDLIDDGFLTRTASATPNDTGIPPNQWLQIISTSELINSTYSYVELAYVFSARSGCNETTWEEDELAVPEEYNTRVSWGGIRFHLAPDGPLPDIEAAGPCPAPIGAVVVLDQLTNGDLACPLFGNTQEEPHLVEECATRIGADAASQVASKMLEAATCTDGQWPDPTGLVGPCPTEDEESTARVSLPVLVPLFLSILVLVAGYC